MCPLLPTLHSWLIPIIQNIVNTICADHQMFDSPTIPCVFFYVSPYNYNGMILILTGSWYCLHSSGWWEEFVCFCRLWWIRPYVWPQVYYLTSISLPLIVTVEFYVVYNNDFITTWLHYCGNNFEGKIFVVKN